MKTNIYFKRYIKNDPNQKKEIDFYPNGEKEWFLNNKRHREDGAAIIHYNGKKTWWIKNHRFSTKKHYQEALEIYKNKNNI